MREFVYISLNVTDFAGEVHTLLHSLGLDADVAKVSEMKLGRVVSVFLDVTIAADDPRLPRLQEALRRMGKEWLEGRHDHYTEDELMNARLLVLLPAGSVQGAGGARYGTAYDFSVGCKACGTGSPQTSALFIDGRSDQAPRLIGQRVATTYAGDVLVDERIAEELDALAPTGLDLRSVYAVDPDTKRQTKLRWRQLCALRTLPPRSPRTTGLFLFDDRQCPVCKRDGSTEAGEAPPRYTYRAVDVTDIDDVNESWEWFYHSSLTSYSGHPDLARPRLLVTPRVMRVFRAAGVVPKQFNFIPIRIVDE